MIGSTAMSAAPDEGVQPVFESERFLKECGHVIRAKNPMTTDGNPRDLDWAS